MPDVFGISAPLDKGANENLPDEQKRANHIFANQLFGIAITELTSSLSRRFCDSISAIAIDGSLSAYVTGEAASPDFPYAGY